jgi:hypothetical protein
VLEHIAHGFSSLPPNVTIAILGSAVVVAFVRGIERAILLVIPVVVGLVLSALSISPIGSRTDIYLYPTFAILVAVAVQPLLRRSNWTLLIPVGILAALLAVTPFPRYYPQEDVAPLVARLESHAQPADPVLVYRMGQWGFALYTHWPVRIVRNANQPVPFSAVVGRRRLYDITTDQLALVGAVEHRTGRHRLWFIGAHGRVRSLELIDRAIERGGFVLESRRGDRSAWLQEFVPGPKAVHPA